MDTRFDLWKQTAFGLGKSRFSWQLAVTEERNRQGTEIYTMLVPNLAGILLHLKAIQMPPKAARMNSRLYRERQNNCLFFEPSKFRRSCNEALQSHYPLKPSTFCIPQAVGTDAAKPTSCMRTAFNKLNQRHGSELKAPFVNVPRNF